ncbi:hypothetical protein DIPPA_08465 [Diplonema papillatum]|nr:hypothetical protein DIPPA_08465 [Diplonema papillatum]
MPLPPAPDAKLERLCTMFPSVDREVARRVFEASASDNQAIDALLRIAEEDDLARDTRKLAQLFPSMQLEDIRAARAGAVTLEAALQRLLARAPHGPTPQGARRVQQMPERKVRLRSCRITPQDSDSQGVGGGGPGGAPQPSAPSGQAPGTPSPKQSAPSALATSAPVLFSGGDSPTRAQPVLSSLATSAPVLTPHAARGDPEQNQSKPSPSAEASAASDDSLDKNRPASSANAAPAASDSPTETQSPTSEATPILASPIDDSPLVVEVSSEPEAAPMTEECAVRPPFVSTGDSAAREEVSPTTTTTAPAAAAAAAGAAAGNREEGTAPFYSEGSSAGSNQPDPEGSPCREDGDDYCDIGENASSAQLSFANDSLTAADDGYESCGDAFNIACSGAPSPTDDLPQATTNVSSADVEAEYIDDFELVTHTRAGPKEDPTARQRPVSAFSFFSSFAS